MLSLRRGLGILKGRVLPIRKVSGSSFDRHFVWKLNRLGLKPERERWEERRLSTYRSKLGKISRKSAKVPI